MRQITVLMVLWLACGSPVFANPASDTLACIDAVALEDEDGWLACMSNFSNICMDAGQEILDIPPQTSCQQELEKAVQKRADPIIAAGIESDASIEALFRGAELERTLAHGAIECDYLQKTTVRPEIREESKAYSLALCRSHQWAYTYWTIIAHDQLK